MNYARLTLAAVVAWSSIRSTGIWSLGWRCRTSLRVPRRVSVLRRRQRHVAAHVRRLVRGDAGRGVYLCEGSRRRSGFEEGLRFGVVYRSSACLRFRFPTTSFTTMAVGWRPSVQFAAFVEMILAGVILGLVYKPASTASRQARAVGV